MAAFALFIMSNQAHAAVPVITFSANDPIIPVDGSTTLNWNVVDAVSCSASGAWSGNQPMSGSYNTGSLSTNTTYVLNCTGNLGEPASSQVDIIVADPPVVNLSADSTTIPYNSSANLSWTVTGAQTCEGEGDWTGSKPFSGTYNTGNLISSKSYTLFCNGVGGPTRSTITITIESPSNTPELNFSSDRYFIGYDESVTLQWSSTNADACIASGDWSGSKPLLGSQGSGNLQNDRHYVLTCSNSSGGSIARIIDIVVAPRPVDPPELTFTADDYDIDYGTSTTLRWTSNYTTSCNALGTFGWSKPTTGTYDTGALFSSRTYTLRCYGDGGTRVTQNITINVGPNPNPVPTLNFSAQNDPIAYNTSTTLNWTTTNADTCSGSGAWGSSSRPTSGSYNTGNLTGDASYSLSCDGPGGNVSQTITVTVGDPTNPPDVNFWADDYNISYNSSTTVRWTSDHANWCTLSYNSSSTGVALDGSYGTGNLINDTIFSLSCGNTAGTTTQALTINVNMTGPPPTINLWADENPIDYGSSTTVRWTTTDANSCVMIGVGSVPINGSMGTGTLYSARTYTLECIGPGGLSQESITININASTIPSDPPDLLFWADRYNLLEGENTDLHWIATNADWCDASLGWNGSRPSSGDENTGALYTTTSYRITCGNVQGTTSSTLTINVGNLPDVRLDFWADEYVVPDNGSTTLNWDSTNATTCYTLGGRWGWYNYKPVDGSEGTGTLWSYSNLYVLQCRNFNSSETQSLTIYAGDPPPSVSFYAASTVIGYNTPATLFWDSWNTTSCRAWSDNSGELTWNGDLPTSGTNRTSNLTRNTRFYLRCYGPGGTRTRSIRVRVSSPSANVPSINFWADAYLLPTGDTTDVNWTSQDATGCRAFSDPSIDWSGGKSLNGSEEIGPITEETDLYLVCWNGSGSSSSMLTIRTGSGTVVKPSLSLWADAYSLASGDSTNLHWQALNADSCVATGDWSGPKNIGVGSENTGPITTTKRYTLECSNSGGSVQTFVDIVVGGPALAPTLVFSADDYDVEAGDPVLLNWQSTNATECIASSNPLGAWSGGQDLNSGGTTVYPQHSAIYSLTCNGPGGSITATVPIKVAKVIVCPQNISLNLNQTRQLTAYYMQDAALGFNCNNLGTAVDITSGYDGFPTEWNSEDESLVSLELTPGLIRGLNYTTLGAVGVCATYKETTGCTDVLVALTCWRCNPDSTCSPEPVATATCSEPLIPDKPSCLRICGLKWGEWREITP